MSLSLGIWLAVAVAKAVALVATWRPKLDRGLICLRWYLLFSLGGDIGSFLVLRDFGYGSHEYLYTYYLVDLAIIVFGFLILVRLVELAFEKSTLRLAGLRTTALLVSSGLAVGSGAIIYLLRGGLTTAGLAREMEQNFSFLGMILAVMLFVILNLMQVPGVRFRRVVLSFSLLYSAGAIVYALTALIPIFFQVAYYAVPVTSLAGMSLIAYSLLVPEPERKARPVSAPWLTSAAGRTV